MIETGLSDGPASERLTERQRREVEYHRDHARRFDLEGREVSFDILRPDRRSWWNASWAMYTDMLAADPAGARVLVVGCGFGEDAIRLARLGARVSAFDISPEVLAVARRLAARYEVDVAFAEMACEEMAYPADRFDWIVVRDILHHVDIPATMAQLARVARDGARVFINEVYSHALTRPLRRNRLIDRWLYPRLKGRIYEGREPYITADERKCDQRDIAAVTKHLADVKRHYFSMLSGRLFAPSNALAAKVDRALLACLDPVGRWLGGRVLVSGRMKKTQ